MKFAKSYLIFYTKLIWDTYEAFCEQQKVFYKGIRGLFSRNFVKNMKSGLKVALFSSEFENLQIRHDKLWLKFSRFS